MEHGIETLSVEEQRVLDEAIEHDLAILRRDWGEHAGAEALERIEERVEDRIDEHQADVRRRLTELARSVDRCWMLAGWAGVTAAIAVLGLIIGR